ncbi:TPA: helix-turn-helix domain-containing protein [Acinetobacter baumannii]|nr:helix-turn-helix domain-containing protein [Acinetobacter baumannii]
MKISTNSPRNIDEAGKLINYQIGKRLKTERERLELNQAQFGEIVNVSKRTVSDWERGLTFPNIYQAILLAQQGLDLSRIFDTTTSQSIIGTCFDEIMFDDDPSLNIRSSLVQIDAVFEENPSWKLLNIESLRDSSGMTIGVRYFYQKPNVNNESEDVCVPEEVKRS